MIRVVSLMSKGDGGTVLLALGLIISMCDAMGVKEDSEIDRVPRFLGHFSGRLVQDNRVDTLFSVPGLDDLDSIIPGSPSKTPITSRFTTTSPISPPRFPAVPGIQFPRQTFHSLPRFPATFPGAQDIPNNSDGKIPQRLPTTSFGFPNSFQGIPQSTQRFPNLFDPFNNFFPNSFNRFKPTTSPPVTPATTPATTPPWKKKAVRKKYNIARKKVIKLTPTKATTSVKPTTALHTTPTTTTTSTTISTTTTLPQHFPSREFVHQPVHEFEYNQEDSEYDSIFSDYDYPNQYQTTEDEDLDNQHYDYQYYQDDSDDAIVSSTCPSSLRECVAACAPVLAIQQAAYKLCVNECLERCT